MLSLVFIFDPSLSGIMLLKSSSLMILPRGSVVVEPVNDMEFNDRVLFNDEVRPALVFSFNLEVGVRFSGGDTGPAGISDTSDLEKLRVVASD